MDIDNVLLVGRPGVPTYPGSSYPETCYPEPILDQATLEATLEQATLKLATLPVLPWNMLPCTSHHHYNAYSPSSHATQDTGPSTPNCQNHMLLLISSHLHSNHITLPFSTTTSPLNAHLPSATIVHALVQQLPRCAPITVNQQPSTVLSQEHPWLLLLFYLYLGRVPCLSCGVLCF